MAAEMDTAHARVVARTCGCEAGTRAHQSPHVTAAGERGLLEFAIHSPQFRSRTISVRESERKPLFAVEQPKNKPKIKTQKINQTKFI